MSEAYRTPSAAITAVVDALPTPEVSVSPDGTRMLVMQPSGLPPIRELAQPELHLAGLRINPRTNGASRDAYYTGLTLQRIPGGEQAPITGPPESARLGHVSWSPDGTSVAFSVTGEEGIELWAADVASGRARRLTAARLNAVYGTPFHWRADSRSLICRLVPVDRGAVPVAPAAPVGPVIQESRGKKAPARTFQDLLKNTHDEALFEHYLTAQVALVTLAGETTPLGARALILRAEPAPDGEHLLWEALHRPFSYLVTLARFPRRVEVRDGAGRVLRVVAELPLAEEVPVAFDAVPTGPRAFSWRADTPATLCWVEAQDGGDPRAAAEVRDRLCALAAPFDGDPTPLASFALRYRETLWGSDALALVTESWWQTRQTRTWVLAPGVPHAAPRLLFDRSSEDRYGDPGRPLLRANAAGRRVLHTAADRQALFLAGAGASPEGDRPFLDRLELDTHATTRLWRSEEPYYEELVRLLDDAGSRFLTRRESPAEPPNYFLRDLHADPIQPLTAFPHPAPELAPVTKELLRYEREDGVTLTATLYLPPGYEPADGPLPLVMWAYPREFKDAGAAGQVTSSPYRFIRVTGSSPLLFLLQGYAVLDNPTMPIVGVGDAEPNDTYVAQLSASARAAVEAVVRRGVADRDRIAVGGHSYGGFMTANLLAHSELFRAGIARSGAYNRTLTPFGFQSEERTLWEAPEIYAAMSPFMHADKIRAPLLLLHGEADNNSGTFPLQSERFYAALKGHGATTRLVLLPHESHGYQARESVLHVLWEMTEWLERYMKGGRV